MKDLAELTEMADQLTFNQRLWRNRFARELEEKIDAKTFEEREELSRAMHELHAAGTPKHKLAKAIRKAGNPSGMDKIWNTYQPDVQTDLRRKNQEPVKNQFEWDGDTLTMQYEGEELVFLNCNYEEYASNFDELVRDSNEKAIWPLFKIAADEIRSHYSDPRG